MHRGEHNPSVLYYKYGYKEPISIFKLASFVNTLAKGIRFLYDIA